MKTISNSILIRLLSKQNFKLYCLRNKELKTFNSLCKYSYRDNNLSIQPGPYFVNLLIEEEEKEEGQFEEVLKSLYLKVEGEDIVKAYQRNFSFKLKSGWYKVELINLEENMDSYIKEVKLISIEINSTIVELEKEMCKLLKSNKKEG